LDTEVVRLTDLCSILEHQRNVMANQLAHAEVEMLRLKREMAELQKKLAGE